MITLSFDNCKINVPQSWGDIRLGDYERWFHSEVKSQRDKVELIAGICGTKPEVFLEKPTALFDIVTDMVSFVFADYEGADANRLTINNTDYMIAVTDELTLAEWVDVEAVYTSESESRLSDILSIICRPAGEVYDSRKSDGRKLLFRNLTMDKVLPLLAFFLRRKEKFKAVSNLFLQVKEQAALYLELTRSFVKNGDGIKLLPIWQRIKFYFLTAYLEKQLSKFSDSCSTVSIKQQPKRNRINFWRKFAAKLFVH